MFGFKRNIKKEQKSFDWNGNKVKLTIYHELRKDSRVSLSKSGVNIRLPLLLPEFEKQKMIFKFINWAKKRLDEKPYFHYDKYRKYKDQEWITLFDRQIQLSIQKRENKNASVKLINNDLYVFMPVMESKEAYEKKMSHLVYKTIAKLYKPIIWDWLNSLNEKHQFGQLNSVRMKNNSTNWGSCSTKGNINISVRLLLAPQEVVEYVLIHELSHLQQQNHSPKFWSIVAQACPNYEQHELWLKTNAKYCVF